MENKICCAGLILSALALGACATQTSFLSPLSPIEPVSVLPTPFLISTVMPSPTDTATPWPTATATATATPTMVPSPTPTFPPYDDKPFKVIFLRNGDLWLSEVGGSGEQRLTFDNPPWQAVSYAISPDNTRIAYLSTQYDLPDVRIMQVSLQDGTIGPLAGDGDLYLEEGVAWLDNSHIYFRIGEFRAAGHAKDEFWEFEPFNHLIVDLATQVYRPVPDSLGFTVSPNGRYWALFTCYYVYECPTPYKVRDLKTGAEWQVVDDRDAASLTWSPDNHWLLVAANGWHAAPPYSLLYVVDLGTHKRITISSMKEYIESAVWTPDSEQIVYSTCGSEPRECGVWIIGRDGSSIRPLLLHSNAIPTQFSWTSDGSRLTFVLRGDRQSTVWSMKSDGTNVRPVIENADMPSILPE